MSNEKEKVNQIPKKQLNSSSNRKSYFFGYIRVSSIHELERYSLESQRKKLILFGVPEENIYCDVKSATTLDERLDLQRLLKTFNPEEETKEDKKADPQRLKEKNLENKTTLVVVYLDQVFQSLKNFFSLIKRLENYGVGFISLDMPSSSDPFINEIIFTTLLWLAEFQLKDAKEKQKIGIQKAKENGKYLDRKNRKLTPNLLDKIKTRLETGRSPIEIYKTLNISKSSYYKALRLIAPPPKSTEETEKKKTETKRQTLK